MKLDSDAQRTVLLNALMSQPIQGDYQGIVQMLPQFTAVVEAVKAASVEVPDGQQPEQ